MTEEQKEKAISLFNHYVDAVNDCQAKFGKVTQNILEINYKGTYNYFTKYAYMLSKKHGKDVSVWDVIRHFCPEVQTETKRFVSSEMVVSALNFCQEKYGAVSRKNLLEVDSGVFYYLSHALTLRKKQGESLDMWDIAREFVPGLKVNKKVNYYAYTVQSLEDCYQKYSCVSLIYLNQDWPLAYRYIGHVVGNRKNKGEEDLTMADVCRELAPQYPYEETKFYDSEDKIINAISAFVDNNGFVDNFRADSALYGATVRYAKRAGMHYSKWIEEKSREILGEEFKIASFMQETEDLVENHKKRIEEVYGVGGSLDGISVDHPELYMLLRTARQNMGGKKISIQDAAKKLGFTFENAAEVSDSKIDERCCFEILWKTFPSGVVKKLDKHPEAAYALSELCLMKKMSIDESLAFCGMRYARIKKPNGVKHGRKILNINKAEERITKSRNNLKNNTDEENEN